MKKSSPNRMIVVSNRLPVSITPSKSGYQLTPTTGGLASALEGVHHTHPFSWLGWPGASFESKEHKLIEKELASKGLIPVFLNADHEKFYYHGMCNAVLWPLFHYFTDRVTFCSDFWHSYVEVNTLFTQKLAQIAPKNSTVWIHDFHFMLIPSQLRNLRPDLSIGFFLHIPFPSSELFRTLPPREELLMGMLGSDYISFHTHDYMRHFRLSCVRILGIDAGVDGIAYEGRKIGLGNHPIGIDVSFFKKVLKKDKTKHFFHDLKQRFQGRKVILGVERLDYTKGIAHKLDAIDYLLEKKPEWAKKIVYLQVIVPSRLDLEEYQSLKSDIEERVGHINGKHSTPGFSPIHYLNRYLHPHELAALYRFADVAFVTPIRDGMNLVCQEYIYCQYQGLPEENRGPGMLVLSEFAGSSHSLPKAILVNPLDLEQMSLALEEAIDMPKKEKQDRMNHMGTIVVEMDSPNWAKQFLMDLEKYSSLNKQLTKAKGLLPRDIKNLSKSFLNAEKAIFIFDYDGTLREITKQPDEAKPSPQLLELLKKLAEIPHAEVHIVSGRDHHALQKWLGHLPLYLCAEHGYMYKKPKQSWKKIHKEAFAWKPQVKDLLQRVVSEVPGSVLEEKSCSLAWHYRLADVGYGEWRAKELKSSLEDELKHLPVEVLSGRKLIEVRAAGVHKGTYVTRILSKLPQKSFVLCIGDDRTDLDMYPKLPPFAISIHVGNPDVPTKYSLESPAKVRELIAELLNASKT